MTMMPSRPVVPGASWVMTVDGWVELPQPSEETAAEDERLARIAEWWDVLSRERAD